VTKINVNETNVIRFFVKIVFLTNFPMKYVYLVILKHIMKMVYVYFINSIILTIIVYLAVSRVNLEVMMIVQLYFLVSLW